jgi:DNA-binding transcriptional MerR regulator
MQIGELARQSGVSAKTIRYYESIGLLCPPSRGTNNYRQYTVQDQARLRFIAGARALGIDLATVKALVAAWEGTDAPCAAVQTTLAAQIARIDQQIAALVQLRTQLVQLHQEGATRPRDRTGQACICALVAEHARYADD